MLLPGLPSTERISGAEAGTSDRSHFHAGAGASGGGSNASSLELAADVRRGLDAVEQLRTVLERIGQAPTHESSDNNGSDGDEGITHSDALGSQAATASTAASGNSDSGPSSAASANASGGTGESNEGGAYSGAVPAPATRSQLATATATGDEAA